MPMYHQHKPTLQIFLIFSLSIIVLVTLFLVAETDIQPSTVAAQEPKDDNSNLIPVNPETLARFGLSPAPIQASSVISYDLEVVQKSDVLTVTSGSRVTFTVSITNNGPNVISYTLFRDAIPSEMQDITYAFSANVFSDSLVTPIVWLLYDPIPVSSTVLVTISGILTSAQHITVTNTTTATPLNSLNESNWNNNVSQVQVGIVGYDPSNPSKVFYFPIIFKSPPAPSLLYSDDFSNSSSGWGKDDDDICDRDYNNNEYRIEIDDPNEDDGDGEDCWGYAPSDAEYTYGNFQIKARQSGGSKKFEYGIYINGAGANSNYVFKLKFNENSCTSSLLRNGNTLGSSVNCSSASNNYNQYNTLKINHNSSGVIKAYLNGQLLHTYSDGSQLTGKGVGVYTYVKDDDVTIRFDNFTVHGPD